MTGAARAGGGDHLRNCIFGAAVARDAGLYQPPAPM